MTLKHRSFASDMAFCLDLRNNKSAKKYFGVKNKIEYFGVKASIDLGCVLQLYNIW